MERGEAVTAKFVILVLGLFSVCVYTAFILSTHNPMLVTGVVVAIALFIFSFLSPRISLYLLIFSMLLSPEFGARDYTGRGFTLRFEDLLLMIMGFAWLAKSAVFKGIGVIPRTPLNGPIALYILICAFSTLAGIMRGDVSSPLTGIFFVLKYFEYFVIFFLTVNNTQSREQIRGFLWAIFITYIIVLVVALLQIPQGVRISAPFEGESAEPNTLGGYLLIMFSLTVLLLFSINNKLQKSGVALLGVLCMTAILYTLSRSTWLGFIPMYLALIRFTHKRNILIATALVSMALLPVLLPQTVIDRFQYTFRGDTIREGMEMRDKLAANPDLIQHADKVNLDSSTMARLNSIQLALRDFQKKPVLGYGVTGHDFIDAQYFRVLVETGILGFGAFFLLIWTVGKVILTVWREHRGDPLYNIIAASTFCSLVGLLFHGIGTNTFIIVRIMEPFWCLVGLCVAIPIVEGKPWYVRREEKMTFGG